MFGVNRHNPYWDTFTNFEHTECRQKNSCSSKISLCVVSKSIENETWTVYKICHMSVLL